MTALPAALASVAFAALLAVTGYVTPLLLLAVTVGLGALVLGLGWPALLDLPAPRGSSGVIVATGWAAAFVGLAVADVTRPLAPFAALLALGLLLAFGHELVRRDGRARLVESITGTASGQTLALLGGGWVLLPGTPFASAGVLVAAAAVAGSRLASLAPLPERVLGWVALAVGTAAGAAGAVVADRSRLGVLVALAVSVAAVAAGLDRLVQDTAEGRGTLARLAAAMAPVLAAGTVAYAVARIVG